MFVPSLGASAITSDWNCAVTFVSAFTVSSQVVVVPEHAPPQPMNRVRPAGDAVRVTVLPPARVTSHVAVDSPQFRPPPVTVPGPVTEATRCACDGGGGGGGCCAVKFAYTARSLLNVNVQPPGPLQPAPQPSKLKPLAGVASSEIEIPSAKSAPQVDESQSSPAGREVTRPRPCTITVSRR